MHDPGVVTVVALDLADDGRDRVARERDVAPGVIALDGPEISEDEHEVVLHAEEPVVETRAVPKERVRLETDTVTDEETVSGEVRKERIDVEGDAEDDR